MSVDIDATPDLLLLIQQKLHIVQYRYGSLSLYVPEQGFRHILGRSSCTLLRNDQNDNHDDNNGDRQLTMVIITSVGLFSLIFNFSGQHLLDCITIQIPPPK